MSLACEAIVSAEKAGYKTGIEICIPCIVDTAKRNAIIYWLRRGLACEIYKLKERICITIRIRIRFYVILMLI